MCLVRARIVGKRHDFHTPEPHFLDRPLYNQADLLSATVGPTVNEFYKKGCRPIDSLASVALAVPTFPPSTDANRRIAFPPRPLPWPG